MARRGDDLVFNHSGESDVHGQTLSFRGLAESHYFGLAPDYTGLGLGAFFLGEAIAIAWDKGPRRLHVQTCTLDHPRALPLYQRFGFQPFGQVEAEVLPMGDEPHPLVAAQRKAAGLPEPI